MLNHSTCNLFFVQQPRRSARRSPGSARGFGRVAQVRAEVRVTHKQFSRRILRISSSSVPSECLASQFPASVAGRSSQRPRVSCACFASRFDLIELPSLSEQKCDLDGIRHCSSGGLHGNSFLVIFTFRPMCKGKKEMRLPVLLVMLS